MAEENNTNQTTNNNEPSQTQPGEGGNGSNNQTTNGGEHKNVSMEDFNALQGQVGEILTAIKGQGNNKPSNNNQKPNGDDDNSGNGENNNGDDNNKNSFDITKDPQFQKMQKELNDIKSAKQRTSLMSVANAEAKKNGVSIKGFENNLIGKDEDSTKQMVQAFSKTVKSQTNNNTAGGFNPNASDGSHDDRIVDLMMKNKFGPNYKGNKK